MFVADVLVAAATAMAKIRTRRLDAMRRSFENFDQLGFRELLFVADDPRRDAFAINREGNKDRLAAIARDTFAAEGDVVNGQLDASHPQKLQASSPKHQRNSKHQIPKNVHSPRLELGIWSFFGAWSLGFGP